MNRDNIDFTKTGVCCLCGAEHNAHFDKAVIRQFGKYTACRVQICPTCLKLFPDAKRIDNGPWDIASVDDIPAKMAKKAADFLAAAKKTLAAAWKKRGDLERWVAEPFEVVGGRTFGQVAMKRWTDAKDKAFAEKLEVIEYFKSKSPWSMRCPACGKPLVLDAPEETELEINDILKFKCPAGCLSFDETELAALCWESYVDYCRGLAAGRGHPELERKLITARSCTAYALDKLAETVLSKLIGEWHDAIRVAGSYGDRCRKCKKSRSYDVCGKCYDAFDAAHPEIRKRVVDGVYGFKKGMNLRDLLEAVGQSNKYRASEHCRFWCAVSPDNAARGVCGATSRPCETYDGRESCRKCGMCLEGKPLGNFLATAGMCQHYKDGKCLKKCGKDGKWEGREDLDVCTFRASHYVFSDKGRFCGNFKLREGLDLGAALDASRAGKSYSGYYR